METQIKLTKLASCAGCGAKVGAGTLAAMLERRGAAVYSADTQAKSLMNTDPELRTALTALLGAQAYTCAGELNRAYLSERIFADPDLLARVDALVHPAVYRDFEHWRLCAEAPYVVLESAILFESGGQTRCDTTVAVCIPQDIRVRRAAARDGVSAERILERMSRQMSDQQRALRADIVVRAVDFEEKEREADRLDALFRKGGQSPF